MDCKTELIWDNTESFSFKLILDNLDSCCGKANTIQKIGHMNQLVRKRTRKKIKYEYYFYLNFL